MNKQKGSANVILIILVIALAAVVIYMVFINKPVPMTQPQSNSVENNIQPATVQPVNIPIQKNSPASSMTTVSTTSSSNSNTYTYSNSDFHFQVQLPSGVPTLSSNGSYIFYRSRGSGDLKYFDAIDVEQKPCAANVSDNISSVGSTTINGISFAKSIGTGFDGGMETSSSDGYYCAMNNGSSYTIILTDSYGRSAPTPNETSLLNEFDREVKDLNFQFTN